MPRVPYTADEFIEMMNGFADGQGWHSNRNILDNWYFADPINQRGQTEYAGSEYTVDRWRGLDNLDKTEVVTGGIKLTAGDDFYAVFAQPIEAKFRAGNQYTLSILFSEISSENLWYIEMEVRDSSDVPKYLGYHPVGTKPGLASTTFTIPPEYDDSKVVNVRIAHNNAEYPGASITVVAAKLELGPVQTLAHKEGDTWGLNDPPPDYGTELLKCQRYYHIFATEDKRPTKKEDFCPPMRIDPKLETIQIGGIDYYAADANL